MSKNQKYCPICQTSVGGFAFCPKCGGKTETLSQIQFEQPSNAYKIENGSNQAALWCHLAPLIITAISILTSFMLVGFFFALFIWVPPLIIKTQFPENEFTVKHAKESFNFQIFWLIVSFILFALYLVFGLLTLGIGLILGFVVLLLLFVPYIIFVVFVQIKACMAASSGKEYRYPLVLFRLMK